VRAVRRAERLVDVPVGGAGQRGREAGLVRRLAGIEAEVLEHGDATGGHVGDDLLDLRARDRRCERDVGAEQLAEPPRHRRHRQPGVRRTLRPPEMTAHDDDRPSVSQRRDRRHRGRDAKVVLDLAVAQRHVEVDPHEDARPAPHVEVLECRELHAVTAAPRSSRYPTKATMSTSRLEYPHSLSYQPRILTMLPFDIVSMAE
jgi:hypothetical protein